MWGFRGCYMRFVVSVEGSLKSNFIQKIHRMSFECIIFTWHSNKYSNTPTLIRRTNEGSALALVRFIISLAKSKSKRSLFCIHHGHIQMLRSWPGCYRYIQQLDLHLHLSFQQLPGNQFSHLNLFV